MHELVIHRALNELSKAERLLAEFPSLSVRTLHVNIGGGRQTMLHLWQGTPAALDAVRSRYVDAPPSYMATLEIVNDTRDGLVLFSVERTGYALDVGALVEKHLGPETVVSLEKDRSGSTWRFLVRRPARVKRFLRALAEAEASYAKKEKVEIPRYQVRSFRKGLGPAWRPAGLTPQERTILEVARELGYFATPRRVTMAQVAKALTMPASTVHYHLRAAERKIVEEALAEP